MQIAAGEREKEFESEPVKPPKNAAAVEMGNSAAGGYDAGASGGDRSEGCREAMGEGLETSPVIQWQRDSLSIAGM